MQGNTNGVLALNYIRIHIEAALCSSKMVTALALSSLPHHCKRISVYTMYFQTRVTGECTDNVQYI